MPISITFFFFFFLSPQTYNKCNFLHKRNIPSCTECNLKLTIAF